MQRGDKSTWLERTGSNQLSTGHRLGQFLLFNTDESPCQDSLDNWTTRRSPDHRKETQTAVVWSCFPLIRSDQIHLPRHSERGKKSTRTKEEVGRQHQGMDRPGVCQVPEGSREQRKIEETGYEVIGGVPTTLAVKG